MFTSRGRILLTLATAGAAVCLLFRQEAIALAAIALVFWLAVEWLWFRWSVLYADAALRDVSRTLNGQSLRTVSMDQAYRVQLAGTIHPRLAGCRLAVEDVVPSGFALIDGSPAVQTDVRRHQHAAWSYTVRPLMAGQLTLPGLHLRLSDGHGLFQYRRFLPLRVDLTVLPYMIRPQTTVSVLKRNNVQLLTGTHRYRRQGFSAELLGIRDYQRGDPPRSIAWKATARLGRLMTCEYESEVPIRATIFADLSTHQFLGRPGTAMVDRIVAATASISRLLLADRDPVAACFVAGAERSRIGHGYGERQLTRLLKVLLQQSSQSPLAADLPLDELIDLTWSNAYRLHPELCDEAINPARPGWVLAPQRRRRVGRRQRLAFVLCQVGGQEAARAASLQHDDLQMRRSCERFLSTNPSVMPATFQADVGQLIRSRRQATRQICQGLLEAVKRAHDNELFVIIGTSPPPAELRQELEESIRVARAAYHRLMLIDVGPGELGPLVSDTVAAEILQRSRQQHGSVAHRDLRDRVTRLGAKMTMLDDPRLMQKIASEIELLRLGRTRHGAR